MSKEVTIGKTDKIDIDQIVKNNLAAQDKDQVHESEKLRSISFVERIDAGRFSYCSAFCMSIFIITGFASILMMVLSMRNSAMQMISEEISYIDCQNPPWDVPPWGFVKQPNDAPSRKIGQPFRYAMPQTILFYSLACASFGLFTVSYFCSELLIQDLGVQRVTEMGDIINKGVEVYLARTMPVIFIMICIVAIGVVFIAGSNFVYSMLVGATTCLACAILGISMNFEGGPRLTHAMNYDLPGAVSLGI